MIAFVLESSHLHHAEITKANLSEYAPDWNVILLDTNIGARMNELLDTYSEPFFITLKAGDQVLPSFIPELQHQLDILPLNSAGIIHEQGDPIVWRTSSVVAHGKPYYAEREQLPFDSYVLTDKKLQLSENWQWNLINNLVWSPQKNKDPTWLRSEEQWQLIGPLLGANLLRSNSNSSLNPFLTIVICSFNNAEYILWSIRSVLAQNHCAWELIIIDDASDDNTQQKLSMVHKDPRIRIYRNSINMGKSQCLNKALSLTTTPWLLELDADDWLPPSCVEELHSYIEAIPAHIAFLYGDHYIWNERVRKQLVYSGVQKAPTVLDEQRLLNDAIPIAPRCYRVEILHQLDGWSVGDPNEGRLYEDFAIIIRILQQFQVRHIPLRLYHRRLRFGSITQKNQDKYVDWKQWIKENNHFKPGNRGPLF